MAKKCFNDPLYNYYKEHRLDKIEIAPAHKGTEAIDINGNARPESNKSDSTGAISRINLGILRGYGKDSIIAKNALYNMGKSGKVRGVKGNLLDGRRMISWTTIIGAI